jgi:cytoskeletal protein CcmA (bactofilin family)
MGKPQPRLPDRHEPRRPGRGSPYWRLPQGWRDQRPPRAPGSTSENGGAVADTKGLLVVQEDTIIKGEVRNCRQIEVFGYVEGKVAADSAVIHAGGRCFGTLRSETAEVSGTLQGNVFVKNLINIRSSAEVSGNVHYGALAMEVGGNLSAEVRNVPPALAGDFTVTVERGRSVKIELEDLSAVDPDDAPTDLIFRVGNASNGFVALASAARQPVTQFSQADLAAGNIVFTHNGAPGKTAGFSVVVTDHAGASSGAPQQVVVIVRG